MSANDIQLPRRRFLQVLATAAGALVVGIPLAQAEGDVPVPPALLGDTLFGLGAYVRIDTEGNVIIGSRDPDTGTGTATALSRIIADELDADWNRVSVVPLGLGVIDNNGQPKWIYGHQTSGLGDSVPAGWADLRQVGAVTRWLLLQAAAHRLNTTPEQLRTEAGYVISPDGRRFGYGTLAEAASKLDPPDAPVALKAPERFTLIGQRAGDADARAVVTGEALFAIDNYMGDMLTAVLSHCPWVDGELVTLDTTDALAVSGVVKVVPIKPEHGQLPGTTAHSPAVAVLATDTWSALQGRAKLKLSWKPGAQSESSAWFEQQAADLINDKNATPTTRVRDDGDVDAIGKKAVHRVEATYVQPWLAHANAEPMNTVARIDKDSATLIVPTQAPQLAWRVVQRLTGLAADQIRIEVPRVGGGYGRRLDHDYVAEAVMLATVAGKAVKLLWTREDDLAHDYYRSASVHKLSATFDRHRHVTGWNQRMVSASALAQRGVPDNRLWTSEVDAHQLPAGLLPNYRSDWYGLPSMMPRGPARGMPHISNAFAVESFIDEIAVDYKEDPLVTRLRLIGEPRQIALGDGRELDTARLLNVLKLVTDAIGWKNWLHSTNGLGLACWYIDGAYVAHAIEVSLDDDRLAIERVVCAVDVGRVINPAGLESVVSGATLDALSTALNLSITYKEGQVQQRSWKDYPLASVLQLPDTTEVIVVPGDRDPTGASFLAMPSAAPALANAVFRVSQVRVRRLPLMRELLRML